MLSTCARMTTITALALVAGACARPTVRRASPEPHEEYTRRAGLPPLRDAHVSGDEEEARLLVIQGWEMPAYLLRVRSSPKRVRAWLYYLPDSTSLRPHVVELDDARELKARLDSLFLWEVADPNADDGRCVRYPDGTRVCRVGTHPTYLAIAVRRPADYRLHTYMDPGVLGDTPVAGRAGRMLSMLRDLARATWPDLRHCPPYAPAKCWEKRT